MSARRQFRVIGAAVAGLLVLASSPFGLQGPAGAQVNRAARSPSRPPKEASDSRDPKLTHPFKVGEKLDYRVGWANFSSAASVRLTVAERRNLYGWDTWHLQALAHTVSPVRSLFVIDDQFDSYTDAQTLASHQYEMYLRELGKRLDSVFLLTASGTPPRGNGPSVVVPPGTRDPVGAFYSLREVDWQHVPEVRMPVYDGRELYEMSARLQVPRQQLAVAAGSYAASKIDIRLYQHGREIAQTHFALWLALDAARTPVLVEADLPFGTLRVELTGAGE
jgi:hypothetical protein